MAGDVHCDVHDWHFSTEDYCPECKGAADERERIIALLAREMDAMRASRSPSDWEQSYGVEIAIGLIDGGHE